MSDKFDITNIIYNIKDRYVEQIETDILNELMKNNKELQQGLLANCVVDINYVTIMSYAR